jgi:hypothetical protein
MSRRFERLVDPCGNWTVWDGQGDIPATYQGQVLSGLTANDARKLTALLNIMHDMECAEAADDGNASSGGGAA